MPVLNYPIVTDRLHLRPFCATDVDAVHAYQGLDEVARYHLWDARTHAQVVERTADWPNDTGEDGGDIVLVVTLADTGQLIGDVFLGIRDREARQGEIGYTLRPDMQGKGYATEAVNVLVDLGFNTLNLHRISARCDVRNDGSWQLMERLGMRREAHFREHALFKGAWDEEYEYAILEDEWRAKSKVKA